MNYTGRNDAFLDFGGESNAVDFGTEQSFNKDFKLVLTNDTDVEQLVILSPSCAPSDPNRVVRDGAIVLGLNCAGDPHSIRQFLELVKQQPTRVLRTRIETNNLLAFTKNLELAEKRLGEADVKSRIKLEKYQDINANNDKIIYVTEQYQLDYETEISLVLPARANATTPAKITVTFEMGASLSTAAALANKAKAAFAS